MDKETDFETTMLAGVERMQTRQEELVANLGQLDKRVTKAFEELTTLKNSSATAEQLEASLARLRATLRAEERSCFRTREEEIIARITGNPERRAFWNGLLRQLAFPRNELPAEMKRALTGVDSSLGQATIPAEVFGEIYDLLGEYGIWNTFDVMPVGARTTALPVGTARPQFYWIGAGTGAAEGTAITEGTFTGTSVSLVIQTLAALIHVQRELLQDSAADMTGYVLRNLAQAVANGLDHACLAANADADQTDAGYTGIFEAALANVNLKAQAADGNITVEKTDLEDWERCITTVNAAVLRRGARWWMHPHILSKAMLVRDAAKRPIFQTALEAPAAGAIGRILGYPVTLADAAPSTNAASAKVATFGDPRGLAVGIRQDMEMSQTDALKFAENQISYKVLMRAGVKLKTASASTVLKPFAVLTLPSA